MCSSERSGSSPYFTTPVIIVLFLCQAERPARAQYRGDDRTKRHTAVRARTPPTIDGRLDDAVWSDANVDDRFTQNFPDEARTPSQRTELRVLYDDTALYIAVRCWDEDAARIIRRLTRRDRETDADRVSIDLSSKHDRTTAYHFDVNVSGVLLDGVRFNDTDVSADWDGLWRAATALDAQGWTAELMIPLQTLRYAGDRHEFGFQVRRFIQRRQEIDEWAYKPRTASGEVSYYGVLDGLEGLRAARLFQVVPFIATGLYVRTNQDPPFLDGPQLYGNVGADLKLGLTPELTLDATFNPDFGQVEADQVVLNLTTFEVFFPEKRPFFLEGVDAFATPLQMFYSRRIGRPPPAADASTYAPREPPAAGRIYAAAKLTGVVAPRLTVAALTAVTAESSTTVVRPSFPDEVRRISTDPLTSFAVLRLKRDLLSRSYVGFMATAVNRFEAAFAEAPQPGDLCPDGGPPSPRGRCTRDSYTGAFDFNLRRPDGDWGALGQVAATMLGAAPRRAVPDGTTLGPGSAGVGLWLDAGKYSGTWWGNLEYRAWSPSYDNNDVGFTTSGNQQQLRPHLHYRFLKPIGPFLEGDITANAFLRFSWDYRYLLLQEYFVSAQVRFRNFWLLYLEVDYDTPRWDLRETRDGTAVARAPGWSIYWSAKTDPRARAWVSTTGSVTPVLHGESVDATMQVALRPKPAIEIDLIPHLSWTWGDPRWFDTLANADGSNTYYFGELESRDFDITVRGTYAFLPTLTLQAYAQLFVDGGHYGLTTAAVGHGPGSELPFSAFRPAAKPAGSAPDFRGGSLSVNLVLRWEFIPGSTLLFVYTRAQTQAPYAPDEGDGRPSLTRFSGGPSTDLFLLKLALLLM